MSAVQITGPAELAVDIADARAALRIDGDDLDGQIKIWLKGIIAALEHEIGQCLMAQRWRVTLDGFGGGAVPLPHPVMKVETVRYVDSAGTGQELPESAYVLQSGRYSTSLTPASRWPATAAGPGAVVIEAVCGYGDAPAATPPNIQLYILAKLIEQFDPATRLERDTVQSAYVTRLLDACRSYV